MIPIVLSDETQTTESSPRCNTKRCCYIGYVIVGIAITLMVCGVGILITYMYIGFYKEYTTIVYSSLPHLPYTVVLQEIKGTVYRKTVVSISEKDLDPIKVWAIDSINKTSSNECIESRPLIDGQLINTFYALAGSRISAVINNISEPPGSEFNIIVFKYDQNKPYCQQRYTINNSDSSYIFNCSLDNNAFYNMEAHTNSSINATITTCLYILNVYQYTKPNCILASKNERCVLSFKVNNNYFIIVQFEEFTFFKLHLLLYPNLSLYTISILVPIVILLIIFCFSLCYKKCYNRMSSYTEN